MKPYGVSDILLASALTFLACPLLRASSSLHYVLSILELFHEYVLA